MQKILKRIMFFGVADTTKIKIVGLKLFSNNSS